MVLKEGDRTETQELSLSAKDESKRLFYNILKKYFPFVSMSKIDEYRGFFNYICSISMWESLTLKSTKPACVSSQQMFEIDFLLDRGPPLYRCRRFCFIISTGLVIDLELCELQITRPRSDNLEHSYISSLAQIQSKMETMLISLDNIF